MNPLYHGDNPHVLRDLPAPESVNLIYLDPPFNSKREFVEILGQCNIDVAERMNSLRQ